MLTENTRMYYTLQEISTQNQKVQSIQYNKMQITKYNSWYQFLRVSAPEYHLKGVY